MMKRSRIFRTGVLPELDDAIAAAHNNQPTAPSANGLAMPGRGLIGITGMKKPSTVVDENGQTFYRAEPTGGF